MKMQDVLYGKTQFRGITAMTVVAHALLRKRRGKRPAMAYCDIRNPDKAYKKAISLICNATELFHIADLMALYTRKNISEFGMDIFYDGTHFLTGSRPFTFEFRSDSPLLAQVKEHLESELPFLKEIVVPPIRSFAEASAWSKFLEEKYGKYHEVSRMHNSA